MAAGFRPARGRGRKHRQGTAADRDRVGDDCIPGRADAGGARAGTVWQHRTRGGAGLRSGAATPAGHTTPRLLAARDQSNNRVDPKQRRRGARAVACGIDLRAGRAAAADVDVSGIRARRSVSQGRPWTGSRGGIPEDRRSPRRRAQLHPRGPHARAIGASARDERRHRKAHARLTRTSSRSGRRRIPTSRCSRTPAPNTHGCTDVCHRSFSNTTSLSR